MADLSPLSSPTLPDGIRSRFVSGINGLTVHLLEAGHETPNRQCVLLLHGFPELAYSWRKIMLPLPADGCRVIAPDQRGYGRTTGWDDRYDGDLASFRMLNLVRDASGLVFALGLRSITAVGSRYERAERTCRDFLYDLRLGLPDKRIINRRGLDAWVLTGVTPVIGKNPCRRSENTSGGAVLGGTRKLLEPVRFTTASGTKAALSQS